MTRTRILLAVAVLALSLPCGAARAVDQDENASRQDAVTPSHAIGGSHDCRDFYPEQARRNGEVGDVLVSYDVLADGKIVNVKVLKSGGHRALDVAALDCVSTHWRNAPAMRGGKGVDSPGHEAIIRFTLTGDNLRASPNDPFSRGLALMLLGAVVLAVGGGLAWLVGRSRRR